DFDITFTADADGNITITSGNATLEKEDDINYIVVVLAACEHTFENGKYCSEGDYHYQRCDSCNYYDPESAEEHYEGVLVDHRCEACNGYVRAWCTPVDAETDHFCSNGEGCGTRLIDLCVDADGDHVCDGCKWVMDWLCEDGDNDHLCDTESCKERLSDCGDDDGDEQCDVCGVRLANVSAKFTELNYAYDADKENILVSGILIVYGNMEGTVTVKWRDGEDEITATGRVTEGFAELEFEGVDLFELPSLMVTFVPDNAEVATWEDNYNLWNDTLRVEVEANDSVGYGATTWINGFVTDHLFLFPGAEVTFKVNLQSGDSYTVEECYFDSVYGNLPFEYTNDGMGTFTFTMPEGDSSAVYIILLLEHDATQCADADNDHRCDSDICDRILAVTSDENGDNLCDVCGNGMVQLGNQKSCSIEELLEKAADGDTVRLLEDHTMPGGIGTFANIWFAKDDDTTVTLDLNGFTLSVLNANYLIDVGNGTLRIIDSSENKTGAMTNPNGEGIIYLSGGVLDLRDYHSPAGITVSNGNNVPIGVTGHCGEEPIKLLLPTGYAVRLDEYNGIFSTVIPSTLTATVVCRAKITGASITAGVDLTMNYYVSIYDPTPLKEGQRLVMQCTMNGKTVAVYANQALVDGEYVFAFQGIAPQQMTDLIDATLVVVDENGEVINILVEKKGYSVKQNAEALLTAHKDDAALVQLVTDLLTYGAAAQNYKDYNNGDPADLANAGVQNLGTPSVALPTDAENVKKLTTHVETLGNVYFTSATVWFDSVNKIGVTLSTTEDVVLKVNGEAVELTGTTYYTDAIYATGFDTVYTFELYEGDTLVQTLTYSVSAYVYAMMDKTEGSQLTEMAELARALYRYGVSAVAYKNAQASKS
ncbi:MAG: hypothetical protein IJX13_07940, partial [Clostridia bacterium]|nr:hypothetical protein [Clostridia bacterium]